MKHFRTTLLLLIAVLPAPALAADAEAGLLAVKALGGVNGQALACAETRIAARAREFPCGGVGREGRKARGQSRVERAGINRPLQSPVVGQAQRHRVGVVAFDGPAHVRRTLAKVVDDAAARGSAVEVAVHHLTQDVLGQSLHARKAQNGSVFDRLATSRPER